jgi:hypothetical protein
MLSEVAGQPENGGGNFGIHASFTQNRVHPFRQKAVGIEFFVVFYGRNRWTKLVPEQYYLSGHA